MRFIKAYFPQSGITVCELDEDVLNFCHEQFKVNTLMSHEDFSQTEIEHMWLIKFIEGNYFDNVTIAESTVGRFGAGIFIQGSRIQTNNCKLIENEISPGFAESVNESYEAGIFVAPEAIKIVLLDEQVYLPVILRN